MRNLVMNQEQGAADGKGDANDEDEDELPYQAEDGRKGVTLPADKYQPAKVHWSTFLRDSSRLFVWSRIHRQFEKQCRRAIIPSSWSDVTGVRTHLKTASHCQPSDATINQTRAVFLRLRVPLGAIWSYARYLASDPMQPLPIPEVIQFDGGTKYSGSIFKEFKHDPVEVVDCHPDAEGTSLFDAWVLSLVAQPMQARFGVSFVETMFFFQEQIYEQAARLWATHLYRLPRPPFIVDCNGHYYVQFTLRDPSLTVQHGVYDCNRDIVLAVAVWARQFMKQSKGIYPPNLPMSSFLEQLLRGEH